MRQPETGRFGAELEVAAAEEWAAAEGVVWPEPELDVDVESGDGVPYLFAVDGFWQRLVGWPRCLSCRWCPSALRKPASTGVPDLHPPAGGSTRLEAMKPA